MDQQMDFVLYCYIHFVRLSPEWFRELLERVGPVIEKEKTRLRGPLPACLKIAIPYHR